MQERRADADALASRRLDILTIKVIAAVVLVIVGIGSGLLPYWISVSERGAKLLEYGVGLAGGIFIGAGLLHLLPDGAELLGSTGVLFDYPTAFLLAGIGFLFVLLLAQVFLRGRDEHDVVDQERFPVVLFLILSIHSFIAGMSMGLELTTSGVLVIFFAIVVHKGFAPLALDISLVEGNVPFGRLVRTIVAFSLMTPLGLLVGTLFAAVLENDDARILEGIFDGLAAGTFLYIASFEMLASVFQHHVDRLKKFAFVAAGFVVMALLALWA